MRLRSLPATAARRSVIALMAVPLLASSAPAAGAQDVDPPADAGSPITVETRTVGLLTGDAVTVRTFADGHRNIELDLADRDGDDVGYDILHEDGQVYVIPSDALALVPDTLDKELFNVTKLVEYGYDLEHGLPVIVAPTSPAAARVASAQRVASVPGAGRSTALPSIGGGATTVAGGDPAFWRAISDAGDDLSARTLSGSSGGATKIWLDEQVEVTLDDSAPMVGAPPAWAAGYDGSGRTVAVLDTGIDLAHPDFAGRIVGAETFLPSGTAVDGHGHDTPTRGVHQLRVQPRAGRHQRAV